MTENVNRITIKDLAGTGPFAFIFTILIFIIMLFIERKFEFSYLDNMKYFQNMVGILLILISVTVFYFSLTNLTPSKHNKSIIKTGPYRYVRHPRYSTLVFCVYPAVCLFEHSILCLLSTVIVYLIFKIASHKEEQNLIKIFGQEYKKYIISVPAFIPFYKKLSKMLL